MNKSTQHLTLTACALAATLFLAACGGGAAVDTTAPTVVITSAAGTGGAVTFAFTFSEDIGTSFTADDVAVTGGTKAATVTKVDATHYTLSVTPDANAGVITATLTAVKVVDLAQNANAVGGESNFLPAITKLSFDETTSATTGMGSYGGAIPTIEAGPAGATGNALKIVKPVGQEIWGGVYFTTGGVSFTTDRKKISAKIYSTRANAVVKLKVEATDGSSVEVAGTTTGAANTWTAVTWDLAAVDLAKTYKVIAITPDADLVTSGVAYYVDDIALDAAVPPSTTKAFTFSETGIGFGPFENPAGGTVAIVTDPTDAGNKVVKFVKKAGDGDYFGTTITGLGGNVVLTSAERTVTMRVYSPAVGTNFLLKFEGGTGAGVPATTEKDMVTTVANAWETLSFVMMDAGTFSTVVVFPHGRSAVSGDTTMLVDDLTFPKFTSTGSGTGGGTANPLAEMGSAGPVTIPIATSGDTTGSIVTGDAVFAGDYLGTLDAIGNLASFTGATSTGVASNGNIGYFNDPAMSTSLQKTEEQGWVVGSSLDPNGVHNFFRSFNFTGTGAAFANAYMGLFVNAPSNGTVNVAPFMNIKLKVWGPATMFERAGFDPVVEVILTGAKVAGCGTGSGGTEISRMFTASQKIGAGSSYKLPLASGWTVKGTCGTDTNATAVASVLAALARVVVNVPGTSFNFTNANTGSPVTYSTGVNLGPIAFTNN